MKIKIEQVVCQKCKQVFIPDKVLSFICTACKDNLPKSGVPEFRYNAKKEGAEAMLKICEKWLKTDNIKEEIWKEWNELMKQE